MPFTIKGGTPQEGESLCLTCVRVHMQRGFRDSEQEVFCSYGVLRPVRFKVRERTDYCSRTLPTRWEMEKIALIIPTQPPRKVAGFGGIGFSPDETEDEELVSTME